MKKKKYEYDYKKFTVSLDKDKDKALIDYLKSSPTRNLRYLFYRRVNESINGTLPISG